MSDGETEIFFTHRHMGGLVFDATFEEVHTRQAEIMNHTAAGGLFMADHVKLGAATLRITAGVSDTPFPTSRKQDSFAKGRRSEQAFELLCQLQEKREPFDVQTGLKLYKNMVCTSLRAKQDKNSAHALFFQAELCQVFPLSAMRLPKLYAGNLREQGDRLVDWGFQQAERFHIQDVRKFF